MRSARRAGGVESPRQRAGRRRVSPPRWSRLVEHDGIAGRAGGADDPKRRPDEGGLHNFLVHEGLRVHVLQVPDAPPRLHLAVAGYGEVRSLLARGLGIAGRGVAHGERDVAGGHVLAGTDAEARLAFLEEITGRLALLGLHGLVAVVAPAVPLPRVERHAVARPDVREPLHL